MGMRRFILGALAVVLVLAAGGCTKRVLVDGTYDQMHTYVLTFEDGTTIKGKIGLNEGVEVVTGGNVYHAEIRNLSLDTISIDEARLIRSLGDYQAASERMITVRRDLEDSPQEFTFDLDKITRIERVKIDPLRTATRSAFWTLTGVVSAFLASEKS